MTMISRWILKMVRRSPKKASLCCLVLICTLFLLASCAGANPLQEETSAPSVPSVTSDRPSSASSAKKTEPSAAPEPTPEEIPDRNQYVMDLTLDTSANTIGGKETVTVVNDSGDTWTELCFRDYPSLFTEGGDSGYDTSGAISQISGVKDLTNKQNLETARSEDDVSVVHIVLQTPVLPGRYCIIELSFVTYIPQLASRFGYMDGVYNIANFYPVLAVYEDGAWVTEKYFAWGECFYSTVSDYRAVLTLPEDMTVISSGLSSVRSTVGGQAVWEINAGQVRDFTLVAGEGFDMVSGRADGITVNCYYQFDDSGWGEAALAAGMTAVDVFNETYGEYPYPELDIVETYLDAGGMEYPNLVMISNSLEDDYSPDGYLSIVVAHETAHQWFYGMVGDNQYTEAWLDESFASYSELVYAETYSDGDQIRAEVDSLEEALESETIPVPASEYYVNRSYSEFEDNYAYTRTVYTRGEIFLYRLREAMGTELFDAALQNYVSEYTYKTAETDDFEAVIIEYAGDNPQVRTLLAKYLRQD